MEGLPVSNDLENPVHAQVQYIHVHVQVHGVKHIIIITVYVQKLAWEFIIMPYLEFVTKMNQIDN